LIRKCQPRDFDMIWQVINDGARAYKGIIPEDRWKEPYMSKLEFEHEISEGVEFWGFEECERLTGVMGIQPVEDVTLIRHAYVCSHRQRRGIGGQLLSHLLKLAERPVVIGTWADATWAIRFYQKHGFQLVPSEQKARLIRRYWTIPERQIETSVVLVNSPQEAEPIADLTAPSAV
jgi:GNAT superfamily N-acetyltransferase